MFSFEVLCIPYKVSKRDVGMAKNLFLVAINNPIPLVFRHEIQSGFKFPMLWHQFSGGAVLRIRCMLTLLTANRHSFSFICHNC